MFDHIISMPTTIEWGTTAKVYGVRNFMMLNRLIQIVAFYDTQDQKTIRKVVVSSQHGAKSFFVEDFGLKDLHDYIKNTPITTLGFLIASLYERLNKIHHDIKCNVRSGTLYVSIEMRLNIKSKFTIMHTRGSTYIVTELYDTRSVNLHETITSEIPISSLSDPNLIDDIIKELISKNPPNAN